MEEKGHPNWIQFCELLGASMNRADDIKILQPDRNADQEASQDEADAKDWCKGDDHEPIDGRQHHMNRDAGQRGHTEDTCCTGLRAERNSADAIRQRTEAWADCSTVDHADAGDGHAADDAGKSGKKDRIRLLRSPFRFY